MSNYDSPQNFSIHFNDFLKQNMVLYKNFLIENMSIIIRKKYIISHVSDIGNRKDLLALQNKACKISQNLKDN